MKRWMMTFGLIAALCVGLGGYAYAQCCGGGHAAPPKPKETQPKQPTSQPALPLCPVMGEPVDFSVRTMTDGGPVYFCCPDCIAKFEKAPAKYADKVSAQREALKKMERVQVTCPVTGDPIDGKTFIKSDGQRIGFCCQDCPAKYQRNPAKYQAAREAGYTYQTRCPVSEEKIDPTAFVDLGTGQRIYICCPGCGEKLTKNPAKYAPKLEEQGVKLDLKKLKTPPDKKDEPSKPGRHDDEHGGHGHP